MKAIIDGLLYDTEKSEFLFGDGHSGLSAYRTKNGKVFLLRSSWSEYTIMTEQEEVRKRIGLKFPEKYIELFGEVEEA